MNTIVILLLCCSAGLVLSTTSLLVILRRKRVSERPLRVPKISILRPLKGLDEYLEDNIESLANGIDYPNYEVLLGVESLDEPAAPIALAAEKRWPNICRRVIMDKEIGLNPKVNQLNALHNAATGEIFVVSDSNVQVESNYLNEIAMTLMDPKVGIVTHPVIGWKSKSIGSTLESLHLGSGVGAGMIAAQAITRISIVVGKSMAMRKEVLDQIGGFEAHKNYLAEDFVMGRNIEKVLNLNVAIAQTPIKNVTVNRSVKDFYNRFVRWGVLQRTCIGVPTYLLQGLLNPIFWGVLLLALHPTPPIIAFTISTIALKSVIDTWQTRILGSDISWFKSLLLVPVKDIIIGLSWLKGGFSSTVNWRGNKLKVAKDNRLIPMNKRDWNKAHETAHKRAG